MSDRGKRRGARRSASATRGLRAMATIVANLRSSVGDIDDATEEADIDAAIRWIGAVR